MVIEEGDGWKDASWAGPAQDTVAWLQENAEMSTFLRTSSGLLCTENKLKVSSIVCTERKSTNSYMRGTLHTLTSNCD